MVGRSQDRAYGEGGGGREIERPLDLVSGCLVKLRGRRGEIFHHSLPSLIQLRKGGERKRKRTLLWCLVVYTILTAGHTHTAISLGALLSSTREGGREGWGA